MATSFPSVSSRDVLYEPNFDADSFRGKELCDRALSMIMGSDLIAMTKLPRVAYPEIVRAFYEKFKFEVDDEGKYVVTVMIGNDTYEFGCKEVARALKIRNRPVKYTKSDPEMLVELMKVPREVVVLRCSHLHEDFWLLDKFLRAYFCPFMHTNELSQYAYKFWHSLITRNVIDVPAMVIEMMAQSHHGAKNKAFPHGLAFARTITALLPIIGCQLSRGLVVVDEFDAFDYKRVHLALLSLKGVAGLKPKPSRPILRGGTSTARAQDEHVEDDSEMPQVPQGQSPYEPFRGTQEELLHRMDERLHGYGTRMEDMYSLVQGYGPTMQDIRSSIYDLDARVQSVETNVHGLQHHMDESVREHNEHFGELQEQMNAVTFQQNEIYRLQTLSIRNSYTEQQANDMFIDATRYAEDEPLAASRRRKTRRNRGNQGE